MYRFAIRHIVCECSGGLDGWSRYVMVLVFFFQAEDGIRDLVRSRGLGDVYKRQTNLCVFDCKFCSYSRLLKQRSDGWVMSKEEMLDLSLIHI